MHLLSLLFFGGLSLGLYPNGKYKQISGIDQITIIRILIKCSSHGLVAKNSPSSWLLPYSPIQRWGLQKWWKTPFRDFVEFSEFCFVTSNCFSAFYPCGFINTWQRLKSLLKQHWLLNSSITIWAKLLKLYLEYCYWEIKFTFDENLA